jgi:oligoendopeptidase F
MNASQTRSSDSVLWDLSDLYASPEDPRIASDQAALTDQAAAFARRYKGRLADLTPDELASLLVAYEELTDALGKLGSFAYLLWSTDTENPVHGHLLQRITEFSSDISQALVFFDVEYQAVPDERIAVWLASPAISKWRFYLDSTRRYKPHTLSEGEEQILTQKSVTGAQAWIRYFDETLGAARFDLDGESLPEQDVLSKLHDPDRALRERAAASLTAGFAGMRRTLTYVFNTLLAEKQINDRLRGFDRWISSRNLSNLIDDASVDRLVEAVMRFYPVVQRYYGLKRRLLGYDRMMDYDRYAPVRETETRIEWNDARTIVVQAYTAFHPDMGRIADSFFENGWIDAAIRPGKRGGAYSASTVPSAHPYVFMNYDGKLRDVQTLAHELGHAVHQYLARGQGALQCDTPLTTAETASVFGEMLVFQSLLERQTDPKAKLSLLMGKIDDTIATVFRQVSMNRFEEAMHTARRTDGELTSERFSHLWIKTQRELYGDSVDLTDGYATWWCYIPHFLHTPGYVYAYAFGELLVLALYEEYLLRPDGFADRYLDLLHAGGSDWPERLIRTAGVDIDSPGFWEQGLHIFERMVNQAERLADEG